MKLKVGDRVRVDCGFFNLTGKGVIVHIDESKSISVRLDKTGSVARFQYDDIKAKLKKRPFKVGDRIEWDGKRGTVVGYKDSKRLNIHFDGYEASDVCILPEDSCKKVGIQFRSGISGLNNVKPDTVKPMEETKDGCTAVSANRVVTTWTNNTIIHLDIFGYQVPPGASLQVTSFGDIMLVPKKEKLKAEFEAEWSRTGGTNHPHGLQVGTLTEPFIGKKTKVTIEEL